MSSPKQGYHIFDQRIFFLLPGRLRLLDFKSWDSSRFFVTFDCPSDG